MKRRSKYVVRSSALVAYAAAKPASNAIASSSGVVEQVDLVPGEPFQGEQALRDAVREVVEEPVATRQPDGEAVLFQPEASGTDQRDVELVPRIGHQEREMDEDLPGALDWKEPEQLGEVAALEQVMRGFKVRGRPLFRRAAAGQNASHA